MKTFAVSKSKGYIDLTTIEILVPKINKKKCYKIYYFWLQKN